MLIGVCGKSASGKSTLARLLREEKDAIHIDIDKIGHDVLTIDDVKKELIKTFGDEVLINNEISRKKLGNIVFNSSQAMDKLTEITWKYMQKEIDNIIKINSNKLIILDWLLLPKTKYFKMCDKRILLDIPLEIRIKRAMKRDNITKEQFLLRDNAGINYNEKEFDYVIKNDEEKYLMEMINLL